LDLLARALDVQDEGMVCRGYVEETVISFACASAVEAVEANIEASRVVLSTRLAVEALRSCSKDSYDRVKALGAVLSVHRLRWSWRTEL